MAFVIDYSKATQRHQLSDGEHEVIIRGASFNSTIKGTEFINVKMVVRNDVDQAEHGEVIDYPLWKSRPENAKQTDIEGVPSWKIHQLSKAARIPEGEVIDSIDDWFKAIAGKPVRITTTQDEQGRAKVTRVDESLYQQMAPEGAIPVTDEDLPF